MGFGDTFGGRGSYPQHMHAARIAVVVAFFLMSLVAIGIPFLASKPGMVTPPPPPPEDVVQLVEVFVPVQRITPGTPLTVAMFQKEAMSLTSVAALGGQPIKTIGEIEGRVAKVPIVPGRVLMADQVMDAPDYLLSKKIQPGYRAITIQLDNVAGIEGWGVPGTKVDVLWYADSAQSDALVTTIVKGAEILSVQGRMNLSNGQQQGYVPLSSPNTEKVFTVTLLVSPAEGQKIFLASRSGELSLMLNGDFDTMVQEASPDPLTRQGLLDHVVGVEQPVENDKLQGVVKAKRPDGSVDEWSVIQGRVWRWDQGKATTWVE